MNNKLESAAALDSFPLLIPSKASAHLVFRLISLCQMDPLLWWDGNQPKLAQSIEELISRTRRPASVVIISDILYLKIKIADVFLKSDETVSGDFNDP